MESNNTTSVKIGNMDIKVDGLESADYIKKVADYVDLRIKEAARSGLYKRSSNEFRDIAVMMNIADDYFKSKDLSDSLLDQISAKDSEIYDLKHDIIAAKIKKDADDKEIDDLKKEINRLKKSLIRMENNNE